MNENQAGLAGFLSGFARSAAPSAIGDWVRNLRQESGQRLAAAAKKEGTEARVIKWFDTVKDLPPEQRLAALEKDVSLINWPGGYAYAKYLAQSVGVTPALSPIEKLRAEPQGTTAAGRIGELLAGTGAGVIPQKYVSPEFGRPYYKEAIRPEVTKYGEPFKEAAWSEFEKYPREKPWRGIEEIWRGEAEEAGELVGAEKWWQEKEPEKLIFREREQALEQGRNLIGDFGYKWVEARMKRLPAPAWIENLPEAAKESLGLTKDKEGHYDISSVTYEDGSPVDSDVQAAYIDLLRTEPKKLEEFNDSERRTMRIIVQGKRAISPGEEVNLPEWLGFYLDNPLATKEVQEARDLILNLISELPLPMVRMIAEFIERRGVRETVRVSEEARPKEKKGLWGLW